MPRAATTVENFYSRDNFTRPRHSPLYCAHEMSVVRCRQVVVTCAKSPDRTPGPIDEPFGNSAGRGICSRTYEPTTSRSALLRARRACPRSTSSADSRLYSAKRRTSSGREQGSLLRKDSWRAVNRSQMCAWMSASAAWDHSARCSPARSAFHRHAISAACAALSSSRIGGRTPRIACCGSADPTQWQFSRRRCADSEQSSVFVNARGLCP